MGQSEQLSEVGRNSSRVLAAPGGHSEMGSLLGGYAPPAPQPPRQQQQQVAVQPQQQQMAAGQRVELRTEHTGITVGNVSSRVLAVPGGASDMASIIAGGGSTAVAPAPARQPSQPQVQQPVAQEQRAAGQRVELRTEHTGITVGNVSSRVLAVPGGASDMASIISGTPAADCSATDRIAALKAKRMQLGDATNDTRGTYSTRPF